MTHNSILLQTLSVEQLQQLIGTSVREGILQLQKEIPNTNQFRRTNDQRRNLPISKN